MGAQSFGYDTSDRVTNLTGAVQGSYSYDGHLRRVRSDVAGARRYHVYNLAGDLVHVDEVQGAKRTDYVKMGKQTIARVTNGVATYLHHDLLGSPAPVPTLKVMCYGASVTRLLGKHYKTQPPTPIRPASPATPAMQKPDWFICSSGIMTRLLDGFILMIRLGLVLVIRPCLTGMLMRIIIRISLLIRMGEWLEIHAP